MQPLLSPAGAAAVTALMRKRPLLLAFDFDGTLAPIVAHPRDARVPPALAARLHALSQRLPVAIVTGRAVADARPRLGFTPRYLVGNHGAEDEADPAATQRRSAALHPLRLRLQAHAADLAGAGVGVEDKGASIALHYRLAPDAPAAQAQIARALDPPPAGLHVFAGKMVVNATAADAPDKAGAMHALVARCAAAAAFFAGDDINDEPVFDAAPAGWLTLRVGPVEGASRARYCIADSAQMAAVLDLLLRALDAA